MVGRRASGRKRAADTTLDGDDAAAIAQSFKAKRTKPATKRTYSSKVSIMFEWIRNKHPGLIEADGENCTLPLPQQAVLGFFGHLSEPAHECDSKNIHADDASSPVLSSSCVDGYRSALQSLDGYLKTINDLKLRGLVDINEGKRYLKWAGYGLLATKLMKYTPSGKGRTWNTGVFAWSFFVLQWNLMSRSDSVDKIMLEHFDWSGDALIVEEQGHKGDQTGAENTASTCPERTSGRHQLFLGTDSKGRFGRALRSAIPTLTDDELGLLGCRTKDIGTHSIRKGSSSYALCQVNGPTPVSVFLRMGQSPGQLKDPYIFSGEGADQLCGRMVAGLPFDSDRFSVLPPHFESAVCRELTQGYWNEIVCGFDKYPRSAHAIFPFLLASQLYHESFLRENLNPSHPIFKARVFANNRLLVKLRGAVTVANGMSPVSSLKATGIPPHLAVAAQVKAMGTELVQVREQIQALENHVAHTLSETVASRVVDILRQSFVIEGAVPVSLSDLERLRNELIGEIRNATTTTQSVERAAPVIIQEEPWMSWDWRDGQLSHAVPLQWEFPVRFTVKQMWDLWYFGDKCPGIRPYRLISKQHDIKKAHHMRYHRVAAVIEALEAIVKEDKLVLMDGNVPPLPRHISGLHVERADAIFTSCYKVLVDRLYSTSQVRRVEELSCGTIYNKLCQYRKSN